MRSEAITSPQFEALKKALPSHQQDVAEGSFGEELKRTLEQVEGFQEEANKAAAKAAGGGPEEIHQTMIKLEEAELSMRLLLKVRTKMLDAYQEVMRMQF